MRRERDGSTSLVAQGPGAAGDVVLVDNFRGELSVGTDAARWSLRAVDGYPHGDGIVATGTGGLVVVPTATHPVTGEPAFAEVAEPLGDADHLRWALMARATTAAGAPGFAVPDGGRLSITAEVAVRGYGLDRHPYGDAVADARRDLRIGAGMLIAADLATGLILDFIVTDGCVLAVYERLAFGGATHAGFSYAVPVADRRPEDRHELTISYDAADRTARWCVGATEVLAVDRLGRRAIDARHLKRDNGRPDEDVVPRQLTAGVALFADRLWGQGFRLTVGSLTVRSSTGVAPGDAPTNHKEG